MSDPRCTVGVGIQDRLSQTVVRDQQPPNGSSRATSADPQPPRRVAAGHRGQELTFSCKQEHFGLGGLGFVWSFVLGFWGGVVRVRVRVEGVAILYVYGYVLYSN